MLPDGSVFAVGEVPCQDPRTSEIVGKHACACGEVKPCKIYAWR